MSTSTPITLEDVANAAAELRSAGRKITILAIRDKLGRGSFTTVKKHLARLEASDSPPAASPVPAQLESLWAEARRAADAELENDRAALRSLSDDLDVRFQTMRVAVAEANAAQSLADTRLADRTKEVERSVAVIADLRAQRDRCEELRAAAEAALINERERSDHRWERLSAVLAGLQNSITQLQSHGNSTADLISASARAVTADLAEFTSLEKESRIQDRELLRREANDCMAPFSHVPASVANIERNLRRLSWALATRSALSKPQSRRRSRCP
ncbi:MAG: DNA-binding protein [Panacagrimonas sp.]